jgi:replication-associated recombination protein RarA
MLVSPVRAARPRVGLTQKYAPQTLADIYGQDYIVKYFSAVSRNPDLAYRNYVLTGPFGSGKTSLVRAFAKDLIDDPDSIATNFLEIDSYQITDRETFLGIKDYIFQETPGYKVVLLDEWHLVPPNVQAGMLKDIEQCSAPIFFFFVSTEREGILDTIFSRSIDFTLSRYSKAQLDVYLRSVEVREIELACQCGFELEPLADETRSLMIFRSFGHIRNLLNQYELVLATGEQAYRESTDGVTKGVEALLTFPSAQAVDALSVFPYTFVQEAIDYFIQERLIKGKDIYAENEAPKIFTFYIKFKRYLKNENDFFSFLYMFADFLANLRKGVNAR